MALNASTKLSEMLVVRNLNSNSKPLSRCRADFSTAQVLYATSIRLVTVCVPPTGLVYQLTSKETSSFAPSLTCRLARLDGETLAPPSACMTLLPGLLTPTLALSMKSDTLLELLMTQVQGGTAKLNGPLCALILVLSQRSTTFCLHPSTR